MKRCFVFTLLSMFSSILFAQNSDHIQLVKGRSFILAQKEPYPTEHEQGDSAIFTISNGKDTLLTELFFPNGLVGMRKWGNDSLWIYRRFGQIFEKRYFLNSKNKSKSIDSSIVYSIDGMIEKIEIVDKEKHQTTILHFDNNGHSISKKVKIYDLKHANSDELKMEKSKTLNDVLSVIEVNDNKMSSERQTIQKIGDIFVRFSYDTSFYVNHNIKTFIHKTDTLIQNTEIEKKLLYSDYRSKNSEVTKGEYYDENGKLLDTLQPDSLRYIPFKDNVNCYYGFKNKKGDTLIRPQFDNVELNRNNFFECDEGLNKVLIRTDGTIVTKQKMQDVSYIDIKRGKEEYSYNDFRFYDNEFMFRDNKLTLFSFLSDGKYGVMDSKGHTVLSPSLQYGMINKYDSESKLFLSEHFNKTTTIDSVTGILIGNGHFKNVIPTNNKAFFLCSDSLINRFDHINYLGLINRQGDIILPQRYHKITNFRDSLFLVDELSEKDRKTEYHHQFLPLTGLFNASNKSWIILPSLYYKGGNSHSKIYQFYSPSKKKFGFMDSIGSWILPLKYDTITFLSENKYIIVQNGKYSIFNVAQHKVTSQGYEYLSNFSIQNPPFYDYLTGNNNSYYNTLIVAKKQGKWGIIDTHEKIVAPFDTYDYVGSEFKRDRNSITKFVKNNKVYTIQEELYPTKLIILDSIEKKGTNTYYTMGNNSNIFISNAKGEIIMPPEYGIIGNYTFRRDRNSDTYGTDILENKEGKRKLMILRTGQIWDFPFLESHIAWAKSFSHLILLGKEDSLNTTGISIANLKTGQLLRHIKEGGMSVGDAYNGTYFVKTTVLPSVPKDRIRYISADTLALDDNDWLMYDDMGRQISKEVFRFPIPFKKGIGLGMVGEKYGLWKSDGTVIVPPQYENGIRDPIKGTFALFKNIGLKNWLVLFDEKGNQLIGPGRYDGISDFFSKYALVKNDKMVGLIDTLGNEIVPLTDISTAYNINLVDSLALDTIRRRSLYPDNEGDETDDEDYNFIPYLPVDSSLINPININGKPLSRELRNMVCNKLIEILMLKTINTAATTRIIRANTTKTYETYFSYDSPKGEIYNRNGDIVADERLTTVLIDSFYMAFSVLGGSENIATYYNFVKKGNTWVPLSTYDIFNLRPDNIQKINDLLVKKIRALTDVNLDCGTSESFWERGQYSYLVSKEGVTFYYLAHDEDGDRHSQFYQKRFEPILLTWAELKLFLKN